MKPAKLTILHPCGHLKEHHTANPEAFRAREEGRHCLQCRRRRDDAARRRYRKRMKRADLYFSLRLLALTNDRERIEKLPRLHQRYIRALRTNLIEEWLA